MSRDELAHFLRERRARLRPEDVRLLAGTRRRTPGPRREEVAGLAHMSVDYYVRLEQARGPRPSAPILDAVADALRLPPAERAHLFRLAGVVPRPPAGPPRRVRRHVTELIHRLTDTAAVVTAANYDVVGWNALAGAVLGDLDERPNLARRRFLLREQVLTDGHEDFAELVVARLRAARGSYPRDEALTALLAELEAGSGEFRELWSRKPVRIPGHRTKTMTHPEVGRLRIYCDVLPLPDDDQQLVLMTADPDSPTARALRHLAAK